MEKVSQARSFGPTHIQPWTRIRTFMYRSLKYFLFSSGLYRVFLPLMKFDMTIAQLHFINSELSKTKDLIGSLLEVGVGGGATSILMNIFMKENGINHPFVAVDTFAGFLTSDIAVEMTRGKDESAFTGFRTNKREWYVKTLNAHGFNVTAVKASIQDFTPKEPIAFCLLDVDLYIPTKEGLAKLYGAMVPGAILIVDDCNPAISLYDGAGAAYREFCVEHDFVPEVVEDKLGVIRKLAS